MRRSVSAPANPNASAASTLSQSEAAAVQQLPSVPPSHLLLTVDKMRELHWNGVRAMGVPDEQLAMHCATNLHNIHPALFVFVDAVAAVLALPTLDPPPTAAHVGELLRTMLMAYADYLIVLAQYHGGLLYAVSPASCTAMLQRKDIVPALLGTLFARTDALAGAAPVEPDIMMRRIGECAHGMAMMRMQQEVARGTVFRCAAQRPPPAVAAYVMHYLRQWCESRSALPLAEFDPTGARSAPPAHAPPSYAPPRAQRAAVPNNQRDEEDGDGEEEEEENEGAAARARESAEGGEEYQPPDGEAAMEDDAVLMEELFGQH